MVFVQGRVFAQWEELVIDQCFRVVLVGFMCDDFLTIFVIYVINYFINVDDIA
jgi:hypothetical protein